jgi:hypothetical protein
LFQLIGNRTGEVMKTKIFFLCLLILSLLTACDQLGIDLTGNANSGGTTVILITDPPDGTHVSVGQIVDITSEVTTPSGAFAVHLVVDGVTYYVDQMYQQTANFQIFQPWTPKEPGVYPISAIVEDSGRGKVESNQITIYVDPAVPAESEEEDAVEQPEPEPALEECPQPMATTHSFANCRSGPGTAYGITEGLRPDQEFMIVGRSISGDWWQVERNISSGTCWIWTNLVEICGDTADVQVVSVQEKDQEVEEKEPEDPSEEPPPLPPASFSACHDYPDFGTCISDSMGFGGCSWDTGQNQCVP